MMSDKHFKIGPSTLKIWVNMETIIKILSFHLQTQKFNFDTLIYKVFENQTKNTKDMGENVRNIRIAKILLWMFYS